MNEKRITQSGRRGGKKQASDQAIRDIRKAGGKVYVVAPKKKWRPR